MMRFVELKVLCDSGLVADVQKSVKTDRIAEFGGFCRWTHAVYHYLEDSELETQLPLRFRR